MPISTTIDPVTGRVVNHVSWKIKVFPNQVEFELKRSADVSPRVFMTVARVPIGQPSQADGFIHGSYDDADIALQPDTKYVYRIDTPYSSSEVSVTTLLTAPDAPMNPQVIQ